MRTFLVVVILGLAFAVGYGYTALVGESHIAVEEELAIESAQAQATAQANFDAYMASMPESQPTPVELSTLPDNYQTLHKTLVLNGQSTEDSMAVVGSWVITYQSVDGSRLCYITEYNGITTNHHYLLPDQSTQIAEDAAKIYVRELPDQNGLPSGIFVVQVFVP